MYSKHKYTLGLKPDIGLKWGFSLVELMISLIVVSIVAATFTPVITKKLKTSSIFGSSGGGNSVSANCQGKFDSDCKLCTKDLCVSCKKTCESGYMLDFDSCKCNQIITINNCKVYSDYKTCETCEDGYYLSINECKAYSVSNCATFSTTEDKCLSCPFGFYLKNNSCTQYTAQNCATYSSSSDQCATCPSGYTLSSGECSKAFNCSGKYFMKIGNLCVTKYNMGDSDETAIPSEARITVVNIGTKCGNNTNYTDKCCWKGATSGTSCNNVNSDYSTCNRLACNWMAANAICARYKKFDKHWRLPELSEMSNWYTNSNNKGNDGLMLCDSSSTSSLFCAYGSVCSGSYSGACRVNAIYSSDLYSNTRAYTYSLSGGSWSSSKYIKTEAVSVRCVADINQ